MGCKKCNFPCNEDPGTFIPLTHLFPNHVRFAWIGQVVLLKGCIHPFRSPKKLFLNGQMSRGFQEESDRGTKRGREVIPPSATVLAGQGPVRSLQLRRGSELVNSFQTSFHPRFRTTETRIPLAGSNSYQGIKQKHMCDGERIHTRSDRESRHRNPDMQTCTRSDLAVWHYILFFSDPKNLGSLSPRGFCSGSFLLLRRSNVHYRSLLHICHVQKVHCFRRDRCHAI